MSDEKQAPLAQGAVAASGIKVQFIRAHRHGGKDYRPGDQAEVSAAAKARLNAVGAIKG